MVDQIFKVTEIEIGFHPAGYRIDKTASAMNRYTKWEILQSNHWCNPKPVCFDSLPEQGWIKKDKFDWERISNNCEAI